MKTNIEIKKEIPKINLVDYGLANNHGSVIEVNKELKEYPDLFDYVLSHELRHTNKTFSVEDLKNDFKFNFKKSFKLMLFVLKRPRIWYEFLPIYKRNNKVFYDINLIISYAVVIFLLVVLFLIIF